VPQGSISLHCEGSRGADGKRGIVMDTMVCKRKELLLFLAFCLLLGGIFFWRGTGAYAAGAETKVSRATEKEIGQAVINAYQSGRTEVDMKPFALYSKDRNQIDAVMEEIINATPGLFYTGRQYSIASVSTTGQIVRLDLTYLPEYMKDGAVNIKKIEKHRKQVDAAVKKALSKVHSGMADIEKALILHDYLVKQVVYNDSESRNSRLTEVGALLEKKANCQGYAVTYKMLLEKAGISARCYSSQKMNHMWNLVKVNSKWYHVDVTWDDPLNERNARECFGVVLHKNFMLSDKGMKRNGHNDCKSGLAKDTRYDNAYWKKVESEFCYQSGKFIYADKKGIYTRKSLTGGKAGCVKKLAVQGMVQKSGSKYYVLAENQIYMLQLGKKKLKSVYKAPSGCTLLELKYSQKALCFRYRKNGRTYTKTIKVNSTAH